MSTDTKLKSEIMRFLQDNGWSRRLSASKGLLRFQIEDRNLSKPVSIYFSTDNKSYENMREELNEALSTIHQYYGIAFPELRHRMNTLFAARARSEIYPRDFVTTRIPDRYVRDDSVDLSIALSAVGYLRNLVAGAAVAESEGGASSRPQAKDYAEACRFGHTFRGSFGFQIECPLIEASQMTLDIFEADRPFGRKVSERIARSMQGLAQAFREDDPTVLVRQGNGLTARMCRDLITFLQSSGLSSIAMGIEYDRYLLPIVSVPDTEFSVSAAFIPLLREASELLSPVPIEETVSIVGRVIVLRASGNPLAADDSSRRIVTVRWDSDSGGRNVQVELEPHEYAQAIRAHERGLHVHIRGLLKNESSKFTLVEMSSFEVLD